ncbi:HAD family hydrolase [Goodfellowiella coeruleoviolacea]|uniref:Sugar-phosphatase n=1 Tax=Goodfellowiella coeruleoviolacea TaxID=334858 RepID=A0AAE3GK72_9PSEU|nr:HAD family phosphatase [Goodfellowiella coeruleoviolacea]MCP2169756.1 sugar-phosphatase [Goodfellowiella coeruleoviolacea]
MVEPSPSAPTTSEAAVFEAALFDLDGTLVDTEPRSQAAWQRLFDVHGVPHEPGLVASFAGRPGKVVLAENLHRFGPGHTVAELFTEALSYATAPAEPVAGAVELVRSLHERGVPIGVVTSGTRDYAHAELDTLGLRPLFDVVITAEDVTAGKPDPEGYLAGCRALGVAPGRTVVFEDAPAGVAAAKAAGAFCVALTTTQPASALASADLVVADLSEVDWAGTGQPTRRVSPA